MSEYPKIDALRQRLALRLNEGGLAISELERINADFEKFCAMLQGVADFSDAQFEIKIRIGDNWQHLGYKELIISCDISPQHAGTKPIIYGIVMAHLVNFDSKVTRVIDDRCMMTVAHRLDVLGLILSQLKRITTEVVEDIVIQHVEKSQKAFFI